MVARHLITSLHPTSYTLPIVAISAFETAKLDENAVEESAPLENLGGEYASDGEDLLEEASNGPYGKEGGHHIHAKSAFRGDPNYDPDKALSISQKTMNANNWSHQAMTSMQRALFDELADSGLPNTMAEHNIIALESLIKGGVDIQTAMFLVAESLMNLIDQGVTGPSRIHWN